ncbi:cephalotocin receptor 1-like isoform X1 [Neodiprion virginianus]|uniref:cephalotocin receptor 1-like isoform X1 n=1 Tax=Neodiprion virginianus TaxID=2961670 RepID=UPI001EE6952B|nr:cephalotocin receptor 1-like isoform X1 [Neodiprion virginianus]
MVNFTGENSGIIELTTAGLNGTTENTNKKDDPRDEYLASWEIATLAAMFLAAVAGNSLVLLAIYLRGYDAPKKNLTRMHLFILHLSIADLLTAILNVFPQLAWEITFRYNNINYTASIIHTTGFYLTRRIRYRFQGGPILCKLVKFGQPLGPYSSSYILTATALDRYKAVCHPLAYSSFTSRRSKITVCLAWSLSLAFCIPQLIVFSYQEVSPDIWDCWATFNPPSGERAYVTWYSISIFILPLLVLVYTYASICFAVWNNTGIIGEARDTNGGPLRQRAIISRAKINSIKQMIAVISFYAVSSSPFIASLLWVTWDRNAPTSPYFDGAAFAILTLMSSLNSCVNPWIYLALNRELWRALIDRVCLSRSNRDENRKNCRKSGEHVPVSTITDVGAMGSSTVVAGRRCCCCR